MSFRRGWLAAALVVLATAVSAPSASAVAEGLLPDLRQAPVGCPGGYGGDPALCRDWDVCMVRDPAAPNGSCLTAGRGIRAVRLRFTTAEDNVGDGPLLLYGHRDPATATMQVRQAVQVGGHGPIPGSYDQAGQVTANSMYYEAARMHRHWHLMGFERMQLRTQGGSTVVTDRKNGFCLGDRYSTADAGSLPNTVHDNDSPEGRLAGYLRANSCGYQNRGATDMTAGISVGSGDDYSYDVDFQWLDITAVPSGVYDLVNTVNADRTLAETRYDNNSSSIAVSLQWPHGAHAAPSVITAPPIVRLLRSCPGKQACASASELRNHLARSEAPGLPRHPVISSEHLHHQGVDPRGTAGDMPCHMR